MSKLHPQLPEGGYLGVSGGDLVALAPRGGGGYALLVAEDQVEGVIAPDGIAFERGARLRVEGPGVPARKIRLVGPGDHRRTSLGEDVRFGDTWLSFGDDAFFTVLSLVALLFYVLIAPLWIARVIRRRRRGRLERARLEAELATAGVIPALAA